MIYADNAATRLGNFNIFNVNSPYADSEKYTLKNARECIAKQINAKPEEIYFTSGGCEANSWILQRIKTDKRHIITTKIEHPSVINTCKWLEKHGYKVTYLDPHFDARDLMYAIDNQTFLISIMHVNNEVGATFDLEKIGSYIQEQNENRKDMCERIGIEYEPIRFHSDCVQSMGKIEIDVDKFKLDSLSASGHKFGDKFGVGFLYCREGVPLEPLIFGGSQENGLRGGTTNFFSIINMAENLYKRYEEDGELTELSSYLVKQLKDLGYDMIVNSPEKSKTGIVSVSFKGVDAEELVTFLSDMQIYVSAGSACHTDHKEASYVLKALDIPKEYINGTIRISLSHFINTQDIKEIVKTIDMYLKLNGVKKKDE